MPYPMSTSDQEPKNGPRRPSLWPAFPDIPIYLDTSDSRAAGKAYGTTPTTPTTPEILVSSRPTYLIPANINASQPSPVDPSPTTTIQTSSDRSVIWPIPEPPPEISHQTQPRRPLLKFFPTEKPRVRVDGLSLQVPSDHKWGSEKKVTHEAHPSLGLGIHNGPPKPPSIRIQPPPSEKERSEPVPNIAQRLEQKLWRYNIEGNVMQRWMIEIVSWLVSAVCMGAIIGVLYILRDQPLSKWPFDRIGLTLNAFVSILSRIAGAALLLPVAEALGQLKWNWFARKDSKKLWDFEMFDNASRGPWGALLLLIHTKGKTIAALGALVTIFVLALDPFFQQVVSFPQLWTPQEVNSTIARVVRHEPNNPIDFLNGIDLAPIDLTLQTVADPFFTGNGTRALPFGNGTRSDIPLSCPSSNCTWAPYETLGMCSQCVETPQLLNFTCVRTRVDWISTLNANVSSYPNATVCGYFLNSTSTTPTLMSGYMIDQQGNPLDEVLTMRAIPLVTNPLRRPLWGSGSINFKHVRNPITNVLISSTLSSSEVLQNKAPVLHECVLAWCVKKMRSSYFEGSYEEETIKTYWNDTQDKYPWTSEDKGSNIYETFYLENATISAPSVGENHPKWGWGVSNDTMLNTVLVFDRMFPSFTTVNGSEPAVFRWRTANPTEVRTRKLSFNPWLLPNNVTRHMERLASALTNTLRASSSSEMVLGDAFDSEMYVSVRWAWLSLPVGLLLISLIFLLATVIRSAIEKEHVSIRKNSAIATLLYGLPDHYQTRLCENGSGGTPRSKAKDWKMRLSTTGRWRVSGFAFSPLTPRPSKNQAPPGWI